MRSCSTSSQVLRVDKNPPHVISMVARHRQQVADLIDTSNKLEKRAEAAERKASEWQQASSDVRKLLEKRDKVRTPHSSLPCSAPVRLPHN